MRQKNRKQKTTDDLAPVVATRGEPTGFELVMNLQCDLRAELGLAPLPHWTKTRETSLWVKNICGNFRRTIFKSILKLKPRRDVNWRYYGRAIGIMERQPFHAGPARATRPDSALRATYRPIYWVKELERFLKDNSKPSDWRV